MAIGSQEINVEIQVSPDEKTLIEQAAALSGQRLGSFTVSAAVDAARRVLDGHRVMRLSSRDWERFLELLDNPPEPNEYLKRAVARYKDDVIQ